MITIRYQDGKNLLCKDTGQEMDVTTESGDLNFNPKELLEASLGLCISITFIKVLERDRLPLENISLVIQVEGRKPEDKENRFSDFDVKIQFPEGLDEAYKAKAMTIIERGCTIGNTLRNISRIHLTEEAL